MFRELGFRVWGLGFGGLRFEAYGFGFTVIGVCVYRV